MAKASASTKTKAVVKSPRKLKKPTYASFRRQKRIKGASLPGAFRIGWAACKLIVRNWKLFGGIVVLYGALTMLLVQGFQATDVTGNKSVFDRLFSEHGGELGSSAGLFLYALGNSSGNVGTVGGVYQILLTLIFSLAIIWAFRQIHAGRKVRIRDTFYQGVGPFVPFILVLIVVGLQIIPLAIGGISYSIVVGNEIAASSVEQVLWALAFFMLALISLYMLASSIFALYIVTLPGMTPMLALRSARELVRYRRWTALRKILFMPFMLTVLIGLFIVPLILFAPAAAGWAFFVVVALCLPLAHGYMYGLYRSLL